jgi:glycosyltransferase involved in cell wall biosynthesis
VELAGRAIPFFEWRGQFRREGFPSGSADWAKRPFRVLYSGRVERNKGALDIPVIAAELERRPPGVVRWDVCGDDSSLPALRNEVLRSALPCDQCSRAPGPLGTAAGVWRLSRADRSDPR